MTRIEFIRTWCAEQGLILSDPEGYFNDTFMEIDIEPTSRFKVRRYGKVVHFCKDGNRIIRGRIVDQYTLPKRGTVGPFCILYY